MITIDNSSLVLYRHYFEETGRKLTRSNRLEIISSTTYGQNHAKQDITPLLFLFDSL
jgi:hypothetical protein